MAAARCSLVRMPVIVSGLTFLPSFSITSGIPGIFSLLDNLPRGISSVAPMNIPLNAALFRSSSVAPYALARSDASPAPPLTAKAPAPTNAPGPSIAVGKKAPKEPTPDASLYVRESLSPPSGLKLSATSFILRRAFSSSSSSNSVAAPIAEFSYVLTKPEARPVPMFSKKPAGLGGGAPYFCVYNSSRWSSYNAVNSSTAAWLLARLALPIPSAICCSV